MNNKNDYLIISLLGLITLPLVILLIIGLLKNTNPCSGINCNVFSIFLFTSFVLITGLLWYTISQKFKTQQEEIKHKNKIKEMIVTSYFNKIEKLDWNSKEQDKNIENLNNMLQKISGIFLEREEELSDQVSKENTKQEKNLEK